MLYASNEMKSTVSQITKILEASGVKCMVPARLNEMTNKGYIFKPDPALPELKLTQAGGRWIETDVLLRIRERLNQ